MADNLYRRGAIWWGRIWIDGVERRRSLRTGHRPEAKIRLKKWKDEVDHAKFYGQSRLTWQKAVTRYVQEVMPTAIKPNTQARYKVSFRQVAASLDGKYLDAIKRRDIGELVGARTREGATNATIRRDLTAVSQILKAGIRWEACEHNPALEYLDGLRERRDPIRLPTDDEFAAALQRAPTEVTRQIMRFAVQTGMRQNEIVTLTWPQVDMVRLSVSLERTKTDAPRVVPLSGPVLKGALFTLSNATRRNDSKVVFHLTDGSHFKNFASNFAGWKRRAGLKFRFHDLRHKFAVDYLRGGGVIYDLQRILGHSSIKTTEGYLAYLTPAEADRAKFGPSQYPAQV